MNPRLYIETERLVLRLPHPDDVRAVHLGIQLSLAELARWMPRALKGQTQKQTRDMIYTQMALFVQDENYQFGIFSKDGGAFVGVIELSPKVPRIPSYEMGFWMRSDLYGNGFMTEAAQAMVDYGFDKMRANRIFLRCEPDNVACQRVAEKIGFIKEAHLRHDALGVDNVTPVDTLVYGLIPSDREKPAA